MPVIIDYTRAWDLLNSAFSSVEQAYAEGLAPEAPTDADGMVSDACREVVASNTQAYREVLLGCIVAKLLSPEIDVRRPYVSQGDHAFNGRTLDERVMNKFLKQEGIPSSAGPYLSVFRRSVQFVPSTRDSLRDKAGYDALLRVLLYVEGLTSVELEQLLRYLLYEFVQLRERATVPIAQPGRISLEQYRSLLSGLLGNPSGGRFPLLLVVATFISMTTCSLSGPAPSAKKPGAKHSGILRRGTR